MLYIIKINWQNLHNENKIIKYKNIFHTYDKQALQIQQFTVIVNLLQLQWYIH